MSFSYLTTDEVSVLWGISRRRVIELCRCGRIKGAQRVGDVWLIPKSAEKPSDARTRSMRSTSRYGAYTQHTN